MLLKVPVAVCFRGEKTLPETNILTFENGCLEYKPFLLGWPIFRCELLVSGAFAWPIFRGFYLLAKFKGVYLVAKFGQVVGQLVLLLAVSFSKKHPSFSRAYIGCGPLTVTVVNEGLEGFPIKNGIILVVTGILLL